MLLIETVAGGHRNLEAIAAASKLPRSTAHRILSALVARRYLRHDPGDGYRLGPVLIELGFAAQSQLQVAVVARPHMERLALESSETVHLGVRDGTSVVYIAKVPGTRGLTMASTVGSRAPLQTTALGKALVAGLPEREWASYFDAGARRRPNGIADEASFVAALARCVELGYAEDREENEAGVRCIGVPIRDATGAVVAALSVSGATIYITDDRVEEIVPTILASSAAISAELGWRARATLDGG